MKKILNKYSPLIIIIIVILYNWNLFFVGNIFFDEDIYSLFDYRVGASLSGWRFDTGIGQSTLIADPTFHAWSILNLFYKIPYVNKILIHNIIYLSLLLYALFSIYYLIKFSNRKISSFYAAILSSILTLFSYKSEFLYVFYMITIIPGICFSSIILFNYFKTKKIVNIYYYFFNLFLVFHLGSAIALQQTILFSFIFFLIYSKYHKNFYIINFLKINIFSIIFLILASMWILYPSLLYLDQYERGSYYKFAPLYSGLTSFFQISFNILFGNLFDKGKIIFPDMNLTPNYHWYANLPSVINLILILFFFKKKVDFWQYLTRLIIVIYIIHITLSSLSPFYESLNTIVISIYPWSKVFLEIFVFQIILLSFFLTNDSKINDNLFIYKIYRNVLFFFYIIFFLIIIDQFLNLNIVNKFLENLSKNNYNFIINNIEYKVLIEILKDYFLKFYQTINIYLILFYFFSILSILFFFKVDFISSKIQKKIIFISFLFIATFFSSKYFSNWQFRTDTEYAWKKYDTKFENFSDRILELRWQIKDYSNTNMTLSKFQQWKIDNNPSGIDNFFGYRSPSLYSFSRISSVVPKIIMTEVYGEKRDDSKNFRKFQFPDYDRLNSNILSNLSINYMYSTIDLQKISHNTFKYQLLYALDDLYIYKNKDVLPYFYLPKIIRSSEGKKFKDIKINSNEVYLNPTDFNNLKTIKFGPGKFKILEMNKGIIKIHYDSKFSNLLVISDLYDKNWKIDGSDQNKIYKANYFFKAILLEPGNYNLSIYYDYGKFLYGIPISIFFILLVMYFYRKQLIKDNLRK